MPIAADGTILRISNYADPAKGMRIALVDPALIHWEFGQNAMPELMWPGMIFYRLVKQAGACQIPKEGSRARRFGRPDQSDFAGRVNQWLWTLGVLVQ